MSLFSSEYWPMYIKSQSLYIPPTPFPNVNTYITGRTPISIWCGIRAVDNVWSFRYNRFVVFFKVMNHFFRHHNIKCLDTIPLYKNHIYLAFWAPGDEKPHFKFAKYCPKSCRKTSGTHFYPFSSIKNLLLKKSVFFFLLPIRIRIGKRKKKILFFNCKFLIEENG